MSTFQGVHKPSSIDDKTILQLTMSVYIEGKGKKKKKQAETEFSKEFSLSFILKTGLDKA